MEIFYINNPFIKVKEEIHCKITIFDFIMNHVMDILIWVKEFMNVCV
ncbi:hypothetical protein DDB_G0291776 [Dictyostelium discoideum AX4]|nr:hypothetical protein DDB_G0291776 [Dictyostelium discoideum AX4]EAL61584.1 hypothetical protein DDB_G0291776 [Dictyostelium discoideum AX4]|eukprot:XP_629986.1 hypothetical protein DDB_G0291776 [Dictyostelium discoideum AX4]